MTPERATRLAKEYIPPIIAGALAGAAANVYLDRRREKRLEKVEEARGSLDDELIELQKKKFRENLDETLTALAHLARTEGRRVFSRADGNFLGHTLRSPEIVILYGGAYHVAVHSRGTRVTFSGESKHPSSAGKSFSITRKGAGRISQYTVDRNDRQSSFSTTGPNSELHIPAIGEWTYRAGRGFLDGLPQ